MKKIKYFVPVLMVMMLLAACGKKEEVAETKTETVVETEAIVETESETEVQELTREQQIEMDKKKYDITFDELKAEVDFDELKEEYIQVIINHYNKYATENPLDESQLEFFGAAYISRCTGFYGMTMDDLKGFLAGYTDEEYQMTLDIHDYYYDPEEIWKNNLFFVFRKTIKTGYYNYFIVTANAYREDDGSIAVFFDETTGLSSPCTGTDVDSFAKDFDSLICNYAEINYNDEALRSFFREYKENGVVTVTNLSDQSQTTADLKSMIEEMYENVVEKEWAERSALVGE